MYAMVTKELIDIPWSPIFSTLQKYQEYFFSPVWKVTQSDHRYRSIGLVFRKIFRSSSLNAKFRDLFLRVPRSLGDPPYALRPFFKITEFFTRDTKPNEHFFGCKLSSARIAIECSFGR